MGMARGQQIYAAVFSAAFILFLLVPLLLFLFGPKKEISTAEKRKLADFPHPGTDIAELSRFPADFDAYYNDHFGLRDQLVKFNNALFLRLFKVSPSNAVVQGKNGWFFYTGEGVLEDFFGQREADLVALEKYGSVLTDRRDWLAGLGVRYLFVPVPNKIGIYQENLPKRVRGNRGRSFYEQFFPFLTEDTDFRDTIDLYTYFQEKKQEWEVYFKTDTHWNNDGAMLAYNRIMIHCRRWFPNLQPIREKDIVRKNVQYSGDLAIMLNQKGRVTEEVPIVSLKDPCASGKNNRHPASLKELKTSITDDVRRLPVENGCPDKELTALVIHDSFGRFLHRYFNEDFKKVIYSQFISFNDLQGLIIKEQPDIVIDLWVARNLHRALVPDQDLEAAMIDALYAASDTVRLRIDGDLDLNTLEFQNDVQLENRATGLLVNATGSDPFFGVGFSPAVTGEHYLVEVVLDSSQDTTFALYFTTADNPGEIVPSNVVQYKIKKGHNKLLFRLPHPQVRGLIRIDPGAVAGSYLLRSLTVKATDRATERSSSVLSGAGQNDTN